MYLRHCLVPKKSTVNIFQEYLPLLLLNVGVAFFTIPNKKIGMICCNKIIPTIFVARFFSAQQPNSIIYGALMTTMATPVSHSAWRRCVRCGLKGEVKAKMASDLDDDTCSQGRHGENGGRIGKTGIRKKDVFPKRI